MHNATCFLGCDGPLPLAPGTGPFPLKGELYRHVQLTLQHVDGKCAGKLRPVLAQDGLLAFIDQAFLSASYYDALPMPWITMRFAEAAGRDLETFTRKMGESGAQLSLQGIYKALFKAITPRTLTARFPKLIEYFYSFTRVSGQLDSANTATITIREMPYCLAEWWCVVSEPYLRLPLELNGAKGVTTRWDITRGGERRGVGLAEIIWNTRWDATKA